ncbi:MAG: zinc ribbon domain-containing protein [Clostridia bacterium]|nr:zinc ribbon domain-containing protein [Clostridia bacterium]
MAKFCEMCGFALEPGSSFCPNCGSAIPADPETPPQPVEPEAPEAPAQEEMPAEQPASFSGFCGMCGSPLDPATGNCPVCSARAAAAETAPREQTPVYTAPPAVPYQPAPAAKPAREKTKKPKNKKSKGRGAIVILLFVLFVILSLVCLSLFVVRNTATEKNIGRILKPVTYEDFTESVDSDVSGQVESIYKDLDSKFAPYNISTHVTDESFAQFVNGSTVRSVIAKKAAALVNGVLNNGDMTVRLTRDEAGEFLEENKKLIEDKLGIDIHKHIEMPVYDEFYGANTTEEFDVKDKMIDAVVEGEDRVFFEGGEIRGDYETPFKVARFFLSYPVIIVLAAVYLALAVLMIILRPGMAAALLGVYLAVIGLLFTLCCLGGFIMPGVFASAAGNVLYGKLIAGALRVNLLIGVIILAAGVVLLAVRGVAKGISKKKNAAAAA